MTESPRSEYRSRAFILAGCLSLFLVAVVGRLAYLQIIVRDELARLAERQHSKTIPLRPRRGSIFDRHGKPLAVSGEVDSIYAVPARIEDPEKTARQLSPLVNEPLGELEKRLSGEKAFVWIKRKVPPSVGQSVRALQLPGIGSLPENLRFYPNRELAAHVLGFEGFDDKGLEGAERAYDQLLAGEPGLALIGRDAFGREVPTQSTVLRPPRPGREIVLALDSTIQYIAEKELDTAWRRTRAQAGMVIVMDPRTGELLALAGRPTFNPNAYYAATPHDWRIRALTDPFEPGSTFKVILAAAALEAEVAKPSDHFFGEWGAITVANRVIHDWRRYGWLTFQEVFQYSSNVGAIKVGMTLGKERYYGAIRAFGFGSLTGLGLPGESRGQVRPPQLWSGLSLASMSIGQEVSVTALQLLSAFAAVANGGRLMQPQLVRSILDSRGEEVRGFRPNAVRQVVSPETARTLTEILTAVVHEGTGKNAAVDGYDVAGKTGTAQKLDPKTRVYSREPGVLSFVGFAPADNPRFAMLVLLDEPKGVVWGSEAAAPIFSAIAGQILRYLQVRPSNSPPVHLVRTGRVFLAAAQDVARPPLEEAVPVMPDLRGKTLRQALAQLGPHDVALEVRGQGVVTRQDPPPGAKLSPGRAARLELAPPSLGP
ncbi:MAG: PASTA domain-containing protein [Candidatus Rokubacteria bacterium]|nr:PASTA domain-containing protein [Candidatus Rokubacteria bacterium]